MLGIPDSCKAYSVVHKKLFYESGGFSSAEKEFFTSAIDKVVCLYCLKPDNINVGIYKDDISEYAEIEVLEVRLIHETKVRHIAELIMGIIPYPIILMFRLEEKIMMWTAHQRTNQNNRDKNVLENFVYTDWLSADSEFFERFNIARMDLTDFYTLYSEIVDTITVWNAECSGIAEKGTELSAEQLRKRVAELEEIDEQISTLKARIGKESQFKVRLEMNVELKKLKEKRKKH